MKEHKLAELIKSGYPHVKNEAGLAPWVLPEHGLNRITDEVGDIGILKVSQPLGLADGLEQRLERAPDPDSVSSQSWQDAVRKWQPLSQVSVIVAAYLETVGPVMAQSQSIKSGIDPMAICRSLAVLLFAPFVDCGRALLEEIAGILDRPAIAPAELINSYAIAVRESNIKTLEKVNRCILKYSDWQEWTSALQEQVLRCRHTPKLIAVTPPPSTDLTGVLVTLIKEAHHGSSGDSTEYPDEPVIAQ